jgi:hypothetical protein
MSIQLETKHHGKITAVLNKVFFCNKNRGFVKELEKLSSYSTFYKSQNTKETIAITQIIDKLYKIYTDCVAFINNPGNPISGELTFPENTGEDESEVETDIEEIDEEDQLAKKSFSTVIKTVTNALGGYKVENVLSKDDFDRLVRDLMIASVIRGHHIFIIMSYDAIGELSQNTQKQSLRNMFNLKSINSPLDTTKYAKAAMGGMEKKLPATNLSNETLSIFLHRNTSFVKYIKDIYQIDEDYVNTVYPMNADKQHLYEAKGTETATDIGNKMLLSITEYPVLSLIFFLKALLSNTPITELKSVLKQADNGLSKKEAEEKRKPESGELDPSEVDGKGDTDTYEDYATYEDYINIDSNRILGDIHREYVTSAVRNTLELLCKTTGSPVRTSFDFIVINNIGNLEKRNLFYDFFDSKFASFAYSPEGAIFVNQLYNGIDNNLPYSVNELKRFLYDLPKNVDDVDISRDNTSFANFINSNEGIKVAYYTFNKVLNNTGDKVSRIKDDFTDIFSLNIAERPFNSALADDLNSTFNIVSKEFKSASKSTAVNKDTVIETYKNRVKANLEAIPVAVKQKIGTNASAPSTYYFLYPAGQPNPEKYRFIFPSKEDFDSKVNTVVSSIESNHGELLAATDPNKVSEIIRNIFETAFGPALKALSRCITTNSKATIANLLLPNPVVIDLINNKVSDSKSYFNYIRNESTPLLLGLCTKKPATEAEAEVVEQPQKVTNTETRNRKLLFLGILHTRLTFLVAIKEFSDYVEEIVNLFTDSIEQLPKEDKAYLVQAEATAKDPETTEIIELVSKNIAYIINKDGDIHPDYQGRIDATLKTREARGLKAKRRKDLQKLELFDDDI